MTLAFEEQVSAILKQHREGHENAIGCLMLAQLSLREGNALAGLIHVNHALDALRHIPKE